MATASSATVRKRSPIADHRDLLIWWSVLGVLALLCVVYAVLPADKVVLRDLLIYPGVELAAILAIIFGVYRYEPSTPHVWLVIAGGVFLWLIGDFLWGVYELVDRNPFPSAADFFYLAGYPLLVFALADAVRRRTVGFDARGPIDAALATVIAALLAWVYIMKPVLDDPALSRWEAIVSIAYPLGDLLLLAVAARFVMGSSWNVLSLRLLVAGLGLTLAGDTMFAIGLVRDLQYDRIWDTMLLVGIVCIGAAALHPSMRALTEEAEGEHGPGVETVSQVLLGAAFLVPVGVLVVQRLRGEPLPFWAAIAALVLVAALVLARFIYVTNRARRAAEREAALSRYGAALLVSTGEEELYAVAGRAASELVGDGSAEVLTGAATGLTWAAHGFAAPIDVRGERVGELVVDASPDSLRRADAALAVVASQLAIALERERLLDTERETAEALSEQNERLLELDRMKDQFVSSVSHELRTPLTSMVGYLELLQEGEAGELEEQQQHFVEIVNRNCLRLTDLVNDILFVARVDAGRLSLELQPVDVGELAASAVESARVGAQRKGVDLQLSISDDVPELQADPMRLTQMLDNLISNAVKFTPEGGNVEVMVSRRRDTVHLDVVDTGVGIPADEVDNLFERFFRASTAAVAPGTGLGLSIVKSIVDLHHGTVSVHSTVDVGTVFTVDLPIRSSGEAAAATPGGTT